MATDGLNSDATPMSIDTDVPSPENITVAFQGEAVMSVKEAVTSASDRTPTAEEPYLEQQQQQQPQPMHLSSDAVQQQTEPAAAFEPVASESAPPIADQTTAAVTQTNGYHAQPEAYAMDDDEP
ncbi:hypothetical protein GGH95_005998, partial [Coemansia sp. RSA 1836]